MSFLKGLLGLLRTENKNSPDASPQGQPKKRRRRIKVKVYKKFPKSDLPQMEAITPTASIHRSPLFFHEVDQILRRRISYDEDETFTIMWKRLGEGIIAIELPFFVSNAEVERIEIGKIRNAKPWELISMLGFQDQPADSEIDFMRDVAVRCKNIRFVSISGRRVVVETWHLNDAEEFELLTMFWRLSIRFLDREDMPLYSSGVELCEITEETHSTAGSSTSANDQGLSFNINKGQDRIEGYVTEKTVNEMLGMIKDWLTQKSPTPPTQPAFQQLIADSNQPDASTSKPN